MFPVPTVYGEHDVDGGESCRGEQAVPAVTSESNLPGLFQRKMVLSIEAPAPKTDNNHDGKKAQNDNNFRSGNHHGVLLT